MPVYQNSEIKAVEEVTQYSTVRHILEVVQTRRWLARASVSATLLTIQSPLVPFKLRYNHQKMQTFLGMYNSTQPSWKLLEGLCPQPQSFSINYWHHYSLLHQNGCIFFPPKVGLLHHTFMVSVKKRNHCLGLYFL